MQYSTIPYMEYDRLHLSKVVYNTEQYSTYTLQYNKYVTISLPTVEYDRAE